jgi:thymidylate synthase (FAD)
MSVLGTAEIIAITQPTGKLIDLTVAEFVAYTARVSNPSNQENHATAAKLLRYLVKHSHWSPFEMVNVVMEINTTRDVARQILRHRSFSFQEFSQRYANPVDDLGMITRDLRLQDTANRQSSLHTDDQDLHDAWEAKQMALQVEVTRTYNWAIQNGVAKEVARSILPEGLINSRMYVNGTLRSWIHYCAVRCKTDTQEEHRVVAQRAWELIQDEFPALREILLLES